jgi:hypothetical protein
MEGKVIRICFAGRNDEGHCASCEFFSHHRKQAVFLFAELIWAGSLWHDASPLAVLPIDS